jgi:subtilisin family serine protease
VRRLRLALLLLLAFAVAQPAAADVQPNDPYWPVQRAAQKLRLPVVWEETTGDPNVVIGLVDTGVEGIPDLEGAIAPGYDLVDNDSIPQDQNSHGTRVAAIIAGRGNDGVGIAGACWGCRVMPVRVSATGTTSPGAIAQGIVYAVNHGARIVNVSLGHPGSDASEAAAVRYAQERGAIVVAAAGNTGNDVPQYPAAYPGVVAVAGTDDQDELYFWSSRGSWVQLAAPGCHIVIDPWYPPGELCGTSFTPAVVAGVLGLLWSRNPALTREQVLEAVFTTAKRVPGVVYGRVDPVAAFVHLGLLKAPPAPAAPPAAPAPPPPTPPAARPAPAAQRFTRQTQLETGTFRRGFRTTFRVGRGRFELHLLTPHVDDCSLTLIARDELIVAAPAVRNLLSLSLTLPAGRYTAAVRCRGDRTRRYSLGVIAMFPRLP